MICRQCNREFNERATKHFYDKLIFAGIANPQKVIQMPPGEVEVIQGLESVKQSILDLATTDQQQLYEFMHNALGLRIR